MNQEATERRKHERIPVKEEAFVVLSTGPSSDIPVIGRIMDISKSGLGFYYEYDEKWTYTPENLALLYGSDNFYLEGIPFDTTSDHNIPTDSLFSKTITRRRGVTFGKLDPQQSSQLDYFIKLFTSAM